MFTPENIYDESIGHVISHFGHRHFLIDSMFIRVAHCDYLQAISTFGLDNAEFYWKAAQAFEKYGKACLLLNGKSGKYGHDLRKIDRKIRTLVSDDVLYPSLNSTLGGSGTTWDDILEKLTIYGSADNRYGIHGYTIDDHDFDAINYILQRVRRLCVVLDKNNREFLSDFPKWDNHANMLLYEKNERDYVIQKGYCRSGGMRGWHGCVSTIEYGVIRPLWFANDEQQSNKARASAKWILDNVHLDIVTVTKIRAMIVVSEIYCTPNKRDAKAAYRLYDMLIQNFS